MPRRVLCESVEGCLGVCRRLLTAALAGWAVLVIVELVLLFGVLRLFAIAMGPDLLPSLKVVFDMGALMACGYVAGRVGRPRAMVAAGLAAVGLAGFDLTPYVPLNVPWLLHLAANAVRDSRYAWSLLNTLAVHALLFGSLLAGAYLSLPREAPMGVGLRS